MDYISEIAAFYDWAETHKISPTAVLLWHAIMYHAHRAHWPARLALPLSVLMARTKAKRDAILDARASLKQAGLIDFQSRVGNQSAIYHILPLAARCPHTNPHTTPDANPDANPAHIPEIQRKKQKIHKDTPFIPPTHEQVAAYCAERNSTIDAQQFTDYYAAKGWLVGSAPMRDWRAALRTWEKNQQQHTLKGGPPHGRTHPEDHRRGYGEHFSLPGIERV